jgi:hypothetical protein
MAICRIALLASLLAVAVAAPTAFAQLPLPDTRTHVDPAEILAANPAAADPEAPRLTFLKPDTATADVQNGYLYVRARCDAACIVEVTAFAKIGGRERQVATVRKALPADKVRRVRLKIRSDVRRTIAAGARFSFEAVPLPAPTP